MTRRPGIVVAAVFAVGAFLGLATSALFLGIDAAEIRQSTESRIAARPGPFAQLVLESIEQQDVFGQIAADVRADQIRNILIAAVLSTVIAVGLGVVVNRRATRSHGLASDATTHGKSVKPASKPA